MTITLTTIVLLAEGLIGSDCSKDLLKTIRQMSGGNTRRTSLVTNVWRAPARMVRKTDSTFDVSRADVSMDERLFSTRAKTR